MPIHIPLLKKKVKLLISSARRPDIQSQQSLAVDLKISNSLFDKVLNDRYNETKDKPNQIPEQLAEKLARCYFLSEETLMFSDLTLFKRHINDADQVLNDLLRNSNADADTITLTVSPQWPLRGIRATSKLNNNKDKVYLLGDKFQVNLKGPLGWSTLLLCKDPDNWYVLSSSTLIESAINDTFGYIKTVMFSFDPPLGQHYFLAISTAKPLSKEVVNAINLLSLPNQREKAIYQLGCELSVCNSKNKLMHHLAFSINSNSDRVSIIKSSENHGN